MDGTVLTHIERVVTIEVDDIRAYGRHGVLPHEQQFTQPFDLRLQVEADVGASFESDDVGDTIDYARLHARVVRLVAGSSFRLLERLGRAILDDVLGDERILRARITIAKPKLLSGATPSVTVEGRRH